MNTKIRLTVLNFLEFAVWGAYLTSMGGYLASVGLGAYIGYFYSIQGFVSIIMPALMGIVADRWMQAQKVLSLCHFLAGGAMIAASLYCIQASDNVDFSTLFGLYSISVAFFMPTIALTNSVSYNALDKAGLDAVKTFPPIRVFGTVGFIVSMWIVDLSGWQTTSLQFLWSGILSVVLALYSLTMPKCETNANKSTGNIAQALGLEAFKLFKNYRMALFFIFSMLLGWSANNKWLCRTIPAIIRYKRDIPRNLWCGALQYSDFTVTDERNIVHPADTLLSEPLRYQEGYADVYVGMGIEILFLCHRKSR